VWTFGVISSVRKRRGDSLEARNISENIAASLQQFLSNLVNDWDKRCLVRVTAKPSASRCRFLSM
jgi:hypothetical protein